MQVELTIDAYTKRINTTSPTLLAAWLVEQLTSVEWYQHTWCRVMVWPDTEFKDNQTWLSDWFVNSHYLAPYDGIKTPREFVERLSKALDEVEGVMPA